MKTTTGIYIIQAYLKTMRATVIITVDSIRPIITATVTETDSSAAEKQTKQPCIISRHNYSLL